MNSVDHLNDAGMRAGAKTGEYSFLLLQPNKKRERQVVICPVGAGRTIDIVVEIAGFEAHFLYRRITDADKCAVLLIPGQVAPTCVIKPDEDFVPKHDRNIIVNRP